MGVSEGASVAGAVTVTVVVAEADAEADADGEADMVAVWGGPTKSLRTYPICPFAFTRTHAVPPSCAATLA